jgi:hypothetical protein
MATGDLRKSENSTKKYNFGDILILSLFYSNTYYRHKLFQNKSHEGFDTKSLYV